MLGPSGHIDTFTRDNLPPAEQWPDFLLDGFDYPEWLNCGYELTDAMVAKARTQYRVGALNIEKLHEVLQSWNYPYEPDANGAVIQVRDREHAAEVLSALVRADVPVDAFGSAGSALEQTYMAMNEERR